MGYENTKANLILPVSKEYSRKKSVREKWIPGIITANGEVEPTDYHGSAHIHALSYSDVVFRVPIGVNELKKGDLVHVRQI